MAIVGVVPAAGYGTRLGSMPGSKEVVPIGGRPVMDYLLERLRMAPCSEVRVVTRPEKGDVIRNALRHGATVVQGSPGSVAQSMALGMAGLSDEDIVLFGFPDTLWEPADGYRRLIPALDAGRDVVLGLFRANEPERSDVVDLEPSGEVAGIEVKPTEPRSNWIWGCGAARAHALGGLGHATEPSEYFNALCDTGDVGGVWLSDTWIDVGTKLALHAATGTGGWSRSATLDPSRAVRSSSGEPGAREQRPRR